VSYQRLKATLTNAVTPLIPSAQARLDGSDWAWGWNVGALIDLSHGTRVGLTYRSSTDYTIHGTLSFNNPALTALGSGAEASLRLPQTASIGLSQQLTPKLRAMVDYTWTGWDSIQSLTVRATNGPHAGAAVANNALNFSNSWRAGLGVEYQVSSPWLLRAGIAYDRSPVQDIYRTPRLPDNDRRWLAVGGRFAPNDRWSVDFGYAYLWLLDAPSQLAPTGPVPGSLIGTYHSHISIFGSQLSFRF
jgi:long-chain fatty acid transport protein